jgi:polysaccharide biosynthesis/export protein
VLGFALAVLLAPQQPAPSPSPTPPPTDYGVGSGDVLEVSVFENPGLSRTTTVQTNGTIALSLLGDVQVAGLTTVEIQRKLEALLERDFLVNPQVEVKIREYQSQFVIVLGEVNTPGRKVLRGRTRLIDILIDAGGLKPSASGELTITRTQGSFDGGNDTLRVQIGSSGMTPMDRINLEIPLRNGDLINVLPRNHATVEGEVARPGRYPIDANSTLSATILEAGGLTRFGSNDVKVRRIDPQTGKVAILEFDLKAIRNGKKPEVPMLPNDVVIVPRRRF